MNWHTHPLFDDPRQAHGPPLTDACVAAVEQRLTWTLPRSLVRALSVCNGGRLRRFFHAPTGRYIRDLAGIGYSEGLDGSSALCAEWDYPRHSAVLSSEGPSAVLLLAPETGGEPPVVWYDADAETMRVLAPTFADFAQQLRVPTWPAAVAISASGTPEEVLASLGHLPLVGPVWTDADGAAVARLDRWTGRNGAPTVRVLPRRRPDGSARMAELPAHFQVVELVVEETDAACLALAEGLRGDILRLQ